MGHIHKQVQQIILVGDNEYTYTEVHEKGTKMRLYYTFDIIIIEIDR